MIVLVALLACVPRGVLKDERLAHSATDRKLDETQVEVLALQRELHAETSANTALSERVTTLDFKNTELREQLQAIGSELASMSTRNRDQAEQKASLEAMLGKLSEDAEAATLEAEAARQHAEALDAERKKLAADRARLAGEAEKLRAEKNALEQKTAEYDQLVSSLEAEIASGEVTITELSGKLTVNMSNAILFDSGATAVKPEGRAALEKVAGVLTNVADREIRVEGHTDDVPVGKGASYADNWALSALRATTVVNLLVAGGVSPLKVAAVGYGEHRPAVANDSKDGRATNRRTEIVLVPRLR